MTRNELTFCLIISEPGKVKTETNELLKNTVLLASDPNISLSERIASISKLQTILHDDCVTKGFSVYSTKC